MRPRAVGGFEPDERDQLALLELWHLSRTALAGTGLDAREHRLQWTIDAFLKEHGHEPNVTHKWIYVWAVDNLGTLTTGEPVLDPDRRRELRRAVKMQDFRRRTR
jgi:hypothetical protein